VRKKNPNEHGSLEAAAVALVNGCTCSSCAELRPRVAAAMPERAKIAAAAEARRDESVRQVAAQLERLRVALEQSQATEQKLEAMNRGILETWKAAREQTAAATVALIRHLRAEADVMAAELSNALEALDREQAKTGQNAGARSWELVLTTEELERSKLENAELRAELSRLRAPMTGGHL
jgi:hypothetical protein